jgi:NAD(P)-dependent dehydrogenase (short-subunit alcohol dehydrogenase family)
MWGRDLLEGVLFPPVRLDMHRLRARLSGKTVLITGASFGIGEEVARLAGAAGASLILVARSADKLEELAAGIRGAGGRAVALTADLTKPGEVEALIARIAEIGPVDIFVSNAGKSIRRSLFESLDRFHDITRTIGVNFLGPAQLTLALIPGLRDRGGQIISISAANALLPAPPLWAAYQASKCAFDQWFRCAAPELRAVGVAATCIYLPLVRTRMIAPTAHYADVPAMQPGQAARLVCAAMIGRWTMWKPWWLGPAELAAAPFRRPWEALAAWQMRCTLDRA